MVAIFVGAYAGFALAGFIWSGVVGSFWRSMLLPALVSGEPFARRRPARLWIRVGVFAGLSLLFATLLVLLSPLGVYRFLWELLRGRWRGEPPPSKDPRSRGTRASGVMSETFTREPAPNVGPGR